MKIVKLYNPISEDNKHILMMEWIAEGVTLIFFGLLVLVMTLTGNQGTDGGRLLYCGWISAHLRDQYAVHRGPDAICPDQDVRSLVQYRRHIDLGRNAPMIVGRC
jgi:hypothetical protein